MRARLFAVPLLAILLAPALAAQDDKSAGLFVEARDLPLVSQSLVVDVADRDATLVLIQVFANDGEAAGQADYRLPLPDGALVTGYGFWQDGSYLAATLEEKAQAVAAHQAAAAEGRPTALSNNDGGRIQSFSVYPVAAGELKQVEVTMVLPVVTEDGRSHLRLPLDAFLGRTTVSPNTVSSTVVVHLATAEPLRDLGADEVSPRVIRRGTRDASFAFAASRPVELWWAEETPPLLARAEAVPVDDGSLAWQLRLAFHGDEAAPRERELVLLVDASSSVRRRGAAVAAVVERVLARATTPVRVVAVGAAPRSLEGDTNAIVAALAEDDAFAVGWRDLVAAAEASGCQPDRPGRLGRRCIALTDPQVLDLPARREAAFEPLFLADAEERIHFAALLGPQALTWDPAVDGPGALAARVDELLRPVLVVEALEQRGGTLEVLPGQRTRVAEGGYLRLVGFTSSEDPLELALRIGGEERRLLVELTPLLPDDGRAIALRREAYRLRLEDWMAAFRARPEPELRQRIVELSLREGIPTPVTAFQVDAAEVLPKTATPAPLLRLAGLLLLALAWWLGGPTWRRG